jgi:hypothetical protein
LIAEFVEKREQGEGGWRWKICQYLLSFTLQTKLVCSGSGVCGLITITITGISVSRLERGLPPHKQQE